MQTSTIDRRTAIKITLIGVSAALLPLDSQSTERTVTNDEPTHPFLAPAMCAELHIPDIPDTGING